MTQALLLTVWHTGTKYFLKGLQDHYNRQGRATYSHLNETWKRKADKADIVYITYRHPLKVAASWANRREFNGNGTKKWMEQWDIYANLHQINPLILKIGDGRKQHGITFPSRPINSFKDELKLHEALANGDMEYYWRKVPRFAVEHALDCAQWVVEKIDNKKGCESE